MLLVLLQALLWSRKSLKDTGILFQARQLADKHPMLSLPGQLCSEVRHQAETQHDSQVRLHMLLCQVHDMYL